jgi:hypothetical protein
MTIETFLHDQAFAQPLETVETAGSIRQPPGRPRRWFVAEEPEGDTAPWLSIREPFGGRRLGSAVVASATPTRTPSAPKSARYSSLSRPARGDGLRSEVSALRLFGFGQCPLGRAYH